VPLDIRIELSIVHLQEKSSRMQNKVKERMDKYNAGGRRNIERQLQEGGLL
jgi:hypothetical protein